MEAFQKAKDALKSVTFLSFPKPSAKLSLSVDASSTGIGAVIQQAVGNTWQPLGYFSKSLSARECKYSTFSRELLAIYLAIKHFRYLLEGRDFICYTDHKPITRAIFSRSDKHSPREANHLDYILQFTSDIRYIKGSDNAVADALSHCINSISTGIDLEAIASDQESDPLVQNPPPSLHFKKISFPNVNKELYCDISLGISQPRIYVPEEHRRNVFNFLHSISHPGIRASQKLLTKSYIWPGINKDVRN